MTGPRGKKPDFSSVWLFLSSFPGSVFRMGVGCAQNIRNAWTPWSSQSTRGSCSCEGPGSYGSLPEYSLETSKYARVSEQSQGYKFHELIVSQIWRSKHNVYGTKPWLNETQLQSLNRYWENTNQGTSDMVVRKADAEGRDGLQNMPAFPATTSEVPWFVFFQYLTWNMSLHTLSFRVQNSRWFMLGKASRVIVWILLIAWRRKDISNIPKALIS